MSEHQRSPLQVDPPELVIRQVERPTPERQGELGGTGAVLGVRDLIDPAGVVPHGEEADHSEVGTRLLGQAEAVLQHPGPVRNAMIAASGEDILFEGDVEDPWDV